MPKYQVMMRNFFSIPNPRTFNNVSQDGGRVIKGLTIMGFVDNLQRCLDNAAGNLRMTGCTIFYEKRQEVDTVAIQILVGVPNTIKEDVIKQTMDEKLKILEKNSNSSTKITN
jgi:hypothetical protein